MEDTIMKPIFNGRARGHIDAPLWFEELPGVMPMIWSDSPEEENCDVDIYKSAEFAVMKDEEISKIATILREYSFKWYYGKLFKSVTKGQSLYELNLDQVRGLITVKVKYGSPAIQAKFEKIIVAREPEEEWSFVQVTNSTGMLNSITNSPSPLSHLPR